MSSSRRRRPSPTRPPSRTPRAAPRRATRAEAKAERARALVDAAGALFDASTYAAVTMERVARAAGLAKGTVYLSFETKEALFLALETERFSEWFDAVDAALAREASPATPRRVARLLARSLEGRDAFVRLLVLLHVVLEQNVDRAAGRAFKELLLRRVGRTGQLLESRLPFLPAGEGAALLMRLHALVLGFAQMASPPPALAELLSEERFAPFRIDLVAAVARTVELLLSALEAEGKARGLAREPKRPRKESHR